MKTIFRLFSVVASMAQLGLSVVPPQPGSGKLEQIVPGVWFREGVPISRAPSRPGEMGNPNAIIIEMKDYLVVVDANYPSGAKLVMAAAQTVSPKPVKYVLVTHHHGDHSYGMAEWRKTGATTVGYVGIAQEMKRYEPGAWQSAAKWRKDVPVMDPPAAEPPMKSFEKSPFVLDDGNRRIEMYFFGWAHTRGDGFIFLPKEKVLCTGDGLANGGFNFLGNGYVRNWNSVLTKAKALQPTYVLPGHGRPGGPDLITGQMLFFTELLKAIQHEIDTGKKLDELVMDDPEADPNFMMGKKKTTITLPQSVAHWISRDRIATQVSDTYQELTQGKPRGEIAGGK